MICRIHTHSFSCTPSEIGSHLGRAALLSCHPVAGVTISSIVDFCSVADTVHLNPIDSQSLRSHLATG
jgi:hypothetical protein